MQIMQFEELNGKATTTHSAKPPKVGGICASWNDYFMYLALLSAKRSKDPQTQVGACIVDQENRIAAIGYNGLPRNCHDDEFPWGKNSENEIEDKKMYVVHAEANAILNKNLPSISGARLYTTLFPCNECAKLIIQSGISSIFYISDKYADKAKYEASKRMFRATGISFQQFTPSKADIQLDFGEILAKDPSSPIKEFENLTLREQSAQNGGSQERSAVGSSKRRLNCLLWGDYFMGIALLSAKRSKVLGNPVGACIVDDENRVISIGYNGLPRNCDEDEFPLLASGVELYDKRMYVVHAESNAILNKNAANISGMRLYTTLFPCNETAKLIIQSGVDKIFYLSDKYEKNAKNLASKRMFDAAGVSYARFIPSQTCVKLSVELEV